MSKNDNKFSKYNLRMISVYIIIAISIYSTLLGSQVSSMMLQQQMLKSMRPLESRECFGVLLLGDKKGTFVAILATCFTFLVGKTSIILQYLRKNFDESYKVSLYSSLPYLYLT